jgi:molybdopterin adenylyltransferase
MIKVAIITVSDTRTIDTDLSGEAIRGLLDKNKYEICEWDIVKDEKEQIKGKIIQYADSLKADLILTTGGTGIGPRDVTPEATREAIEKEVHGISELIRAKGYEKAKTAVISRGVAGIRKGTLIINLPGSPKGAKESLGFILDIIGHAVEMLRGGGH